jgi:hypothetical protein
VVAKGWGKGKWRIIISRVQISVCDDEKVLEITSGDDCTMT